MRFEEHILFPNVLVLHLVNDENECDALGFLSKGVYPLCSWCCLLSLFVCHWLYLDLCVCLLFYVYILMCPVFYPAFSLCVLRYCVSCLLCLCQYKLGLLCLRSVHRSRSCYRCISTLSLIRHCLVLSCAFALHLMFTRSLQ